MIVLMMTASYINMPKRQDLVTDPYTRHSAVVFKKWGWDKGLPRAVFLAFVLGMKVLPTDLPGVCILEPTVHGDARGFFYEGYQARQFASQGLPTEYVQDNFSRSLRGTLRGLHYQVVQPQDKLVWVNQGEVFDVAVDLREGSPTFGRWTGVLLSSENFRRLFVPKGFAHGFLVTSASADVCYKVTDFWCPEGERCLRWDDPAVGIEWPLTPGEAPRLNSRDADAALLADADLFPAAP